MAEEAARSWRTGRPEEEAGAVAETARKEAVAEEEARMEATAEEVGSEAAASEEL